ncbi:MAG TPA: hypothetical protein VJB96_01155 [Patescibacteria group bacterium]|nr:hypothetical protein [Patescibacteria group bacterium]
MFKLQIGYFIGGFATGLILLFNFLTSLPDGKLHIIFCDVGQGDAAYVRFPDGRDMLVDGGPNNKVLGCLGKHMPFWDRSLDLVVLSHPQKDHMQGLLAVFERYKIGYFVRSDVANTTDGYQKLMELVKTRRIKEKFVTTGEQISVGETALTILWPSEDQIAYFKRPPLAAQGEALSNSVLGTSASMSDLNDASVVVWLRYGSFDAMFPGDADTRVESGYRGTELADPIVEVLKVPHHGSKTGMTLDYLNWLKPQLAVISVGSNNTYGHPTPEILSMLATIGSQVLRTDQMGDIEIVSDGNGWRVVSTKP